MVKTGSGEPKEGNLETEVLLSILLVARNVGSTTYHTDDLIAIAAKATLTQFLAGGNIRKFGANCQNLA